MHTFYYVNTCHYSIVSFTVVVFVSNMLCRNFCYGNGSPYTFLLYRFVKTPH